MKCINCLNFVAAHAFLTGWYLFTFFTVAPFWCTPSVILDFCFILLASNTVIWASLVGAYRSKLEVKDFIFHVVVFFRETFQTLAWKFLLCVPQKVFGVYIFANSEKVCRSNWKIPKNRGILKHIWWNVIWEKLMFRMFWNTLKNEACYLRNESVSMKVFLLNMHEVRILFDLGKRHVI